MNLSSAPNPPFVCGRDECCIGEDLLEQGARVEAAVEPVGEAAEIVGRILGEVECLVGTVQGGLQVAEDRIDPVELRQLARLASAHNDPGMRAACLDNTGKARQAVA